jgi:hypothetical protein
MNITFDNWVFVVVALPLEIFLIIVAFFDAKRLNPLEKFFEGQSLTLPVFVILSFITIGIFWGRNIQNAIVYGVISGGFAGYLAGGLAYANFFIHIKDVYYRTIFGGWIGIFFGCIFGAIFAGVVDPIGGQVFGGVFMGFWGGVISGIVATVILHLFRNKKEFTGFFSTLIYYDTVIKITRDLEEYFKSIKNENEKENTLDLNNCLVFQNLANSETINNETKCWFCKEKIETKENKRCPNCYAPLDFKIKEKIISREELTNSEKCWYCGKETTGNQCVYCSSPLTEKGLKEPLMKRIWKGLKFIIYLVNPWVESKEEERFNAFNVIFNKAVNRLDLKKENRTIMQK